MALQSAPLGAIDSGAPFGPAGHQYNIDKLSIGGFHGTGNSYPFFAPKGVGLDILDKFGARPSNTDWMPPRLHS